MTDQKLQLVPVASQTKIAEAIAFCESVDLVTIDDQSQYDNAINLTKTLRNIKNELEVDRKTLVKPFKNKASAIDKEYRKPKKALDNLEAEIRKAIGLYHAKLEKQRQAEHQKLKDELKNGKSTTQPVAAPPPERPDIHFRKRYFATIVNKELFVKHCLDTGDLHLLQVDLKTLDRIGQSTDGKQQIPGIEFDCENAPVIKET